MDFKIKSVPAEAISSAPFPYTITYFKDAIDEFGKIVKIVDREERVNLSTIEDRLCLAKEEVARLESIKAEITK